MVNSIVDIDDDDAFVASGFEGGDYTLRIRRRNKDGLNALSGNILHHCELALFIGFARRCKHFELNAKGFSLRFGGLYHRVEEGVVTSLNDER